MSGRSATSRKRKTWLEPNTGCLASFEAEISHKTLAAEWPYAHSVDRNILIYQGDGVRSAACDENKRLELMAEWVDAFADGPGIIVIKGAMQDLNVVDRATKVFEEVIEIQRRGGAGAGDHFAKPGANDRIWNALEKHCLADPVNFSRYYANEAIALASQAWLGPGYQITAQVNCVNPGGAAQVPHRDYHLGFMTPEKMQNYPSHVHCLSPLLTLQGAVAHCDMSVQSGPTMFLPYSQRFFEGYIAFGRREFQDLFEKYYVQLPLEKGDALFFNPALMHGAGANASDHIYRIVNLLQISSAFGRAMESINRDRMMLRLYPCLLDAMRTNEMTEQQVLNTIAASAEGYAFPTNLDNDPPVGGMAPVTPADITREALTSGTTLEEFTLQIEAHRKRQQA